MPVCPLFISSSICLYLTSSLTANVVVLLVKQQPHSAIDTKEKIVQTFQRVQMKEEEQ